MRLWNPDIAQTLYQRKLLEVWERGMLNMANLNEGGRLGATRVWMAAIELVVRSYPTRYVAPLWDSASSRNHVPAEES